MTQTYAQIQKKIAALQKSADALREREVVGVVARIKTAIEHYGLTAQQLGFGAPGGTANASINRGNKAVRGGRAEKFSDGNGNTWGGMGKRPYWLRDALAAGKSLEDFRTGTVADVAPKSAAKKAKSKKRRRSTVIYRDGAGNSWSGRGPQPRWLKDALAGGKTLGDLKG
ncbi:H-NS family nucleoid-associated regulatory protein [Variovorax sp. LjRoot290]|uniref:H-NS family nucleoid-associated regulatory protein n=1 Tax=Variovorax sp. LjRoot290 TaxID=3342316 RepID=UPI003ECC319D